MTEISHQKIDFSPEIEPRRFRDFVARFTKFGIQNLKQNFVRLQQKFSTFCQICKFLQQEIELFWVQRGTERCRFYQVSFEKE